MTTEIETPTVECASCVIDVPGLFRRVKTVNIFRNADVTLLTEEADGKPASLGDVVTFAKEKEIDGRQIQAAIEALNTSDEGTRKCYRQLPGFLFTVTGHDQQIQQPKSFDGTEEQAEAAGWVQNEFGWCCVECQGTAHETEEGTAGLAGLEEFMNEVQG